MAINEAKMKIVINNYFKDECNVNTSIREAFEKGFRIGVKKGEALNPKIIRCKDCKHWKDSDGVYRRGISAESKCPLNLRAVYEGSFYCAWAERKEGEADDESGIN